MKNDIEKILLKETSLDELIRRKIESEFNSKKNQKKPVLKTVTELKDVPKDKIFTKSTVFRVYNRTNHNETFINGIQADAMIGIQTGIREKFLDKTLSAFSTDDAYIKFEKATFTDV